MKILTFDIEEWFHILDNDSTKSANEWKNYESRIHSNMDRIFNILEETNTKATFFCLGWIAEKYPEIIKRIISLGYEIGCHSNMHQLVYEQTKKEFSDDLDYCIKLLEDLSGKKVKYYRAPGFSITETEKWAFEILALKGIEIDCSIFPATRGHGGFNSYKAAEPSIVSFNGIKIKELPLNSVKIAGSNFIFSGGGYFRIIPYFILKRLTEKSNYVMTYMHPRDFDYGQPIIKELPLSRKFKSYVGLKSAEKKIKNWLRDFNFTDIATANDKIDWNNVKVIDI